MPLEEALPDDWRVVVKRGEEDDLGLWNVELFHEGRAQGAGRNIQMPVNGVESCQTVFGFPYRGSGK